MADARSAQRPLRAVDSRRTGAVALLVAGAAFAACPAVRPYSDAVSLRGAAEAFSSTAWVVAHVLGILGFALLPLGLLGLQARVAATRGEVPAALALVLGTVGAGLVLPYYGAEVFGLRAIGREALARDDASLAGLADAVRYGPGVVLFGAGLLLVAVSGVVAALAAWRSGAMSRWSGAPLALALVLYVPQFWGDQPVRVAHGALVAAGCLWLAAEVWGAGSRGHRRTRPA